MRTDDLGKFIRELMPRLGADECSVALEIYQALAASGTISVAALGGRTGLDPSRVEAIVQPWPGVFRDEGGNIVGFWGLTAQPVSKHVLRINGQSRYAYRMTNDERVFTNASKRAQDAWFEPDLGDPDRRISHACRTAYDEAGAIVSARGHARPRGAAHVESRLRVCPRMRRKRRHPNGGRDH
jgi:hypothetical protein